LLPDATLTPLPVTQGLRTILGGLEIEFAKPPGLNLKLGETRFLTNLNGSQVAHCVIQSVELSDVSTVCRLILEVEPCVTSNKPISGLASAAKGIVTGAVKGTVNGILYGDWGAQSTIVGMKGITIKNEQGRLVRWVQELLEVIEIEHDVDAVKKGAALTKQATGDFKEGLVRMVANVLDVAGNQSRCTVM
jgi:hypothetical protein